METQKIINLLNDSKMIKILLQKMACIVKQQKINTTKTILSNLSQKVLSLFFVVILMHLP